jgi:hypothetical protein
MSYQVTFEKTFKSGNLKGLTVPGSVNFPTLGSAKRFTVRLENPTKDLQGSLAVWSNFQITEVR